MSNKTHHAFEQWVPHYEEGSWNEAFDNLKPGEVVLARVYDKGEDILISGAVFSPSQAIRIEALLLEFKIEEQYERTK